MTDFVQTRAPPFGLWERMLAGRYLRAKRSEGGVALISIISFTGVTLAVAMKWTGSLDGKGIQLAPASAMMHQ